MLANANTLNSTDNNQKEKIPLNLKAILISGFVAGIAICIGAIMMVAPIFSNEISIVLHHRNLPDLNAIATVYFFGISFVFGIFLMFLYAALRHRFGSKIKTAVIAALIVWVLAYLLNNISLVVYGFMPIKLALLGIFWGLIGLLLAGVIGSRIYERHQKNNEDNEDND